ncbi:hypothetical protein U0070_012352, partial [Myodes glareolus]
MVVVDSSCLCESVAPITMAPIEISYFRITLASLSLPKRTQAEKVQQEGCLNFTAAFSLQRRALGEEQTLNPTRQSASRKIKKRRLYDVSCGIVLPHLQKVGNWASTSTLR